MMNDAPRPRQTPRLFNAQNATGSLLLLSGSLALGLTAYWAAPNRATPNRAGSTANAQAAQPQEQALAAAPMTTPRGEGGDDGWDDHGYRDEGYRDEGYSDDGYSDDGYSDDGYSDDGPANRAAPGQQWSNSSGQQGFSRQPMSAPRGFSRGS